MRANWRWALSSALSVGFVLSVATISGCASRSDSGGESEGSVVADESLIGLLAYVPDDAQWNDLHPTVKARLTSSATAYLARVQAEWGAGGLRAKEQRLLGAATPAMIDNYDRVVFSLIASEVPANFKPSTGIANAQLGRALKKLYLVYCASHRDMLPTANPEFKDWDGSDVHDIYVADARTIADQEAYAESVRQELASIGTLTANERAIRDKALFFARQVRRGSTGFNYGGDDILQSSTVSQLLYSFATEFKSDGTRIVSDPEAYAQMLNAFTFLPQKFVNVGTIDAFDYNVDSMVDPAFLAGSGFDPATEPVAKIYLKLVRLWSQRTHALQDAAKSCTVYSADERGALWDAFTADNLANADGSLSLETYAHNYNDELVRAQKNLKSVAVATLNAAFPSGSTLLTAAQRDFVTAAIENETRPANIVATVTAALDQATKSARASSLFSEKYNGLTFIGGHYQPGDAVSAADANTVNAMWEDVKSYVRSHYSGHTVDIAALMPEHIALTTGGASFTGTLPGGGATISIGLGKPYSKTSLYGVLIHEGKHAIDYASHAPVQGAAWEGGGLVAEAMITSRFAGEVMAAEADKLAFYELSRSIDNFRIPATTDATLQLLLRPHCNAGEPNSIDFVKQIVAGYGYSDPGTQLLRSRRAHIGAQYLSYDFGKVIYSDLIAYLQQQVGIAVVVDPYLLQACNVSGGKPDAATANTLRACLGSALLSNSGRPGQ